MIALLVLQTGALLDRLESAPVPFEARILVARDRREADRTEILSGRIVRSPDHALELRGVPDLPEMTVWRRPWKALRGDYSIVADRAAAPPPPEAVVDADGRPIPPAKARLRKDEAAVAEGRDAREGLVVLRLTPRRAELGPKLRVWVDPGAARVVQVASDGPTQATVITLDGFREPGPAEGPGLEQKAGVRSEDPE